MFAGAIVGVLGLAAILTVAWFVLLVGSILGYELGFWGPPFGGE